MVLAGDSRGQVLTETTAHSELALTAEAGTRVAMLAASAVWIESTCAGSGP